MTALAEDSSAPETSSAVTVETKNGETEKKSDTKEAEQQESGQKETSSEQTTSETSSSSQAAESSQPQESSKVEESSQTTANSGTYMEVLWEIDPQAKTLTLTKNTDLPVAGIDVNKYKEYPWYGREKEFSKLVIKGYVEISGAYQGYFMDHVKSVEGIYDANRWYTFDVKTSTITRQGTGAWPGSWGSEWGAKTVIIGGDLETVTSYIHAEYLELGAKVHYDVGLFQFVTKGITVDSQNPYCSSYNGNLYSKDFTELLFMPPQNLGAAFHPALTTLGKACIHSIEGKTIVIPWGVTTIKDVGIQGNNCTVILPDTISNVADQFFKTRASVLTYIVSKNNRAGIKAQTNSDGVGGKITVQVVDSVAKYYPGQVGPEGGETSTVSGPSGEPESSQPSPGPSDGTSQPTTSKPATSQPSTSKPATSQPSTSKPATSQSTSKPAISQPASSQSVTSQPESSMPIESSQPAESSQPESNSESLELSVDPSSDTDESTAAPVENKATGGWVMPVVILVIAAAVAAGVIVLRIRKKQ